MSEAFLSHFEFQVNDHHNWSQVSSPQLTLHPNHAARLTSHDFLRVLIAANPSRQYSRVLFAGLNFYKRNVAGNRVTRKDRTMKLKSQLARDEVHVAPNLGWQCCRQQAVGHQAALLVRLQVMRPGVSGKARKTSYVILTEGSRPGQRVAYVHF